MRITRLFYIHLAVLCAVLLMPAALQASDLTGEMLVHKAQHEDTFIEIARQHSLGYVEMRAANPDIDPWLPGAGTEIIVPAMHVLPDALREGLVINLPEMRLFKFDENGNVEKAYSIGIGREGLSTPTGRTKIVRKTDGPTWRPTKRMRAEDPELPESVPPGPDNPLGTHALYLGWPQYLIHGTNKPYGIGRRVSSGCIRMYPEGITDLVEKVPVGTPVTVVNQPVKAGWKGGTLYLEAHPTTEQADRVEIEGEPKSYRLEEDDMRHILRIAGPHAAKLDWAVIRKVIRERRGYPVPVAAKAQASAG
jgi:L,D-transpeptidase ErfK/SrfK